MIQSLTRIVHKKAKAFSRYRSTLGLGGTIAYTLRRLLTPKGRLIPVTVKNGGKLYLRSGFYDTAIFSQIFIYKELDFDLPQAPETILDCGANIGLATLYFKFKYPTAKIISVEPEQSNFDLLKQNTRRYNDIHLIKKGIWRSTGELFLIDNGEGHASFRVSETGLEKNVIARIEAVAIKDILKDYNLPTLDLLKMDIEGSEYFCFEAADTSWINRVNCIAVEIHEQMKPGCRALINNSLASRAYQLSGEYHIYRKTSPA